MTTSNDDSTQGRSIFSDEERQAIMHSVLETDDKAERREALVELLIDLRQHLGEAGQGWPQLYLELHRLIEWLFKDSDTYALALELYEQRFSLPGGNPAEVLRMILDEQLSPTPRTPQGWSLPVMTGSGSRFSPEQYRKRLEIASTAIFGTDPQRIDGMHGCLKADEATLVRVLSLLEEA